MTFMMSFRERTRCEALVDDERATGFDLYRLHLASGILVPEVDLVATQYGRLTKEKSGSVHGGGIR